MSSYFINQLTEVLKNQSNHSKKEEKPAGDFYSQMKFRFAAVKPNKYISYSKPITYLKRFKSFLYYEWSKRKQEKEKFKLYVSCVVDCNVYIHRYDDLFLFDENTEDIITKIEELDELLSFFFFPDVEVYFCLENGENGRGDHPHILKDLLEMKEEIFLKNYGFCSIIQEMRELQENVKNKSE